jgi:hypothetical protein
MTAQQRDLFTKRYRKVEAPQPSELQIQIALIERLGWMCLPDCVYFHVPNGELRDKRAAAKLKAMGELPGVSDIEFIYNDQAGRLHVLFLELKARGRRPSDDQQIFGRRVSRLGCAFECADSIDQAVEILQRYGILPLTTEREAS